MRTQTCDFDHDQKNRKIYSSSFLHCGFSGLNFKCTFPEHSAFFFNLNDFFVISSLNNPSCLIPTFLESFFPEVTGENLKTMLQRNFCMGTSFICSRVVMHSYVSSREIIFQWSWKKLIYVKFYLAFVCSGCWKKCEGLGNFN